MPSAPLRAGSCAMSATAWSSPRGTPGRWPPPFAGCTTMPRCGSGWGPPRARTSARTRSMRGWTASRARWAASPCRRRLDTVMRLPVPASLARDRRMRRVFVTTIALCCLLLVPAAAHASGRAVIRDCTDDGQLSKTYSQKDYRDALANLPTDVDEYTDCRDVIRKAQLGGAAGGGGGGNGGPGAPGGGSGGGGATTPNGPPQSAALAQAQKGGGAPLHNRDRPGTPGG